MKRVLHIIGLLLLFFWIQEISAASDKKNVLFIFVDDLNTELNCYGNSKVHSPNIDRLAEKGTRFTHAYCQWSVCGPSRASILTGQMPAQSGIRNLTSQLREVNPDVVTLPQYFKNRGYITAGVGKIFDPRNVDDGHDQVSWSIPYNINYTYPSEYGPFVKGQYRVTDNTATEMGPEGVDDDGYLDGQICLDALSKLGNFANNPDQPFFLAVGFKKPHIPFISPKKYWDLYDPETLPLATFQRPPAGSPSYSLLTAPEPIQYDDIPDVWTYNDVDKGDGILDPALQKQLVHGYYACISYIDAQVGKLLDKLDELKLADNTLIVFVSDHGYHLGDHNQWGKHTQLENGVHVPLIIYQPGKQAGISNVTIDLLDLYPTLTNLIFQADPENTTGKSLVPVLNGMEDPSAQAVSEYRASGHASYSFRNQGNRLTLWMDGSDDRPDQQKWSSGKIHSAELFDYQTDRLETVNLYEDTAYRDVVTNMLKAGEIWWNTQYNKINGISSGEKILNRKEIPIENPVRDFLKFPVDTKQLFVRIYDMNGNMVIRKESPAARMYVGDLKPGRYMVLLSWEKMDEVMNYSIVKI